jgi:hypothetical protein
MYTWYDAWDKIEETKFNLGSIWGTGLNEVVLSVQQPVCHSCELKNTHRTCDFPRFWRVVVLESQHVGLHARHHRHHRRRVEDGRAGKDGQHAIARLGPMTDVVKNSDVNKKIEDCMFELSWDWWNLYWFLDKAVVFMLNM